MAGERDPEVVTSSPMKLRTSSSTSSTGPTTNERRVVAEGTTQGRNTGIYHMYELLSYVLFGWIPVYTHFNVYHRVFISKAQMILHYYYYYYIHYYHCCGWILFLVSSL